MTSSPLNKWTGLVSHHHEDWIKREPLAYRCFFNST